VPWLGHSGGDGGPCHVCQARHSGHSCCGGHSTGEQATGEHSTGEQATGEQATGEQATGEQATGEQSTGEQATGEQSTGEQSTGEHFSEVWNSEQLSCAHRACTCVSFMTEKLACLSLQKSCQVFVAKTGGVV
jgi:hypothetical protein